jgi:hypothetical protein
VPLIRTLLGSSFYSFEINDEDDDEDFDVIRNSSPTKRSKKLDTEKHILLHRNRTVVTAIVARVAKGLFRALCVAGEPSEEHTKRTMSTPFSGILESEDEPSILWHCEPTDSGVYKSALIDGVVYNVATFSILRSISLIIDGRYRLETWLSFLRARMISKIEQEMLKRNVLKVQTLWQIISGALVELSSSFFRNSHPSPFLFLDFHNRFLQY